MVSIKHKETDILEGRTETREAPQFQEQPIDIKYEILRHKNRMEELEYTRETNRINHENQMERFRIENAEAKKRDMAHLEREKELMLFRKQNWIPGGAKKT